MALTYNINEEGYHKVFYGEPARDAIFGDGKGTTLYPLHDAEAMEWCQDNCKSAWFRSPPHQWQTFVLFEDPQEAMLFGLTWK